MILQLVAKVIYILLVAVEIILALRFILILLGANTSNQFMRLIISVSRPVVAPFSGLVSDSITLWGFRIDLVSLVALIVLMLVAYGVLEIIRTFERHHE